MAGQKLQPRATKFLKLLAQQLCREKAWNTSPLGLASNVELALRQAVADLPQCSLRSSLESDLPALVGFLQEEIEAATELAHDEPLEQSAPKSPLEVAQGSLLSNSAYSRAVEAAVSAAKRGIEKELGSAWREAVARLLQSRTNPPLALLWAFVAIQKSTSNNGGESEMGGFNGLSSQISVACSLLHSLKFMTAGFCDGPTAIAAAAPVVCMVIECFVPFCTLGNKNDVDLTDKKKAKLWRNLQKLVCEVSGFIALCHHKGMSPAMEGLFKAPSITLGLDIWLSQDSHFSSLFPFAAPAMESRINRVWNSAESVLMLGEIVETEVALLRLVAEVVHERKASKQQNRHEVEKKLKHIIGVYASSLGSSGVLLDMLLDAPLRLLNVLDAEEESMLRGVLGEVAAAAVSKSEMFDEKRTPVSLKGGTGKECAVFLKRIAIARKVAAHFRSKDEHIRASEVLAGLHSQNAPPQLGAWLGARSSLKMLITTTVLQQPRALLDWLLKAKDAEFSVVLEKAAIQRPQLLKTIDMGAVADVDMEEKPKDEETEETLFFFDTAGVSEGGNGAGEAPDAGYDAGQAFVMAAGKMWGAGGGETGRHEREDVLFHRVQQVERKRARAAAPKSNAAKAKHGKKQPGSKRGEGAPPSKDTTTNDVDVVSEDDASMSEDASKEDASMDE